MDLTMILTIASQFVQVANAMVQDGRRQANAQELARLRALTQADIAAIEADASEGAAPAPSPPS